MCGISGWFKTGNDTIFTQKVFDSVFKEIESRGNHASGVACLSHDKVRILKDAVPTSKLIKYKSYKRTISNPDIIIGHARFATHGSCKDNKNNHPHYTADMRYVLIHNGVVSDVVPDVETESECDSEILLRLIERYGIKEGFKHIAKLSNSSYAIMLIDTKTGSLYVFRNTSPALWYDATFETGGILFASTKELLLKGIKKAGLKSYMKSNLHEIKAGTLYKWSDKNKIPVTWATKLAPQIAVRDWRSFKNNEYLETHYNDYYTNFYNSKYN